MPAPRHRGPPPHIIYALRPMAWRTHQLRRKQRDRSRRFDSRAGLQPPRMVPRLVVQPRRRVYRLRDPVDHHVGQQLIARETLLDVAMTIAPRAELLDDPRRQSRRRIVEPVRQRLRLGPLYPLVAGLGRAEFFQIAEKHFLFGRELGRAASFSWSNRDHVDM